MPGSIRSMHLEHMLRDVQTDRANLLHGRLLRWQFDTAILAHRCRRGASTPSPLLLSFGRSQTSPWGTTELPRGRLIGAIAHPNVLSAHPQPPESAAPASASRRA